MSQPYDIKQNPHKGNRGFTRAIHAAKNSWNGLIFAYQEESAFRQELVLLVTADPNCHHFAGQCDREGFND